MNLKMAMYNNSNIDTSYARNDIFIVLIRCTNPYKVRDRVLKAV